MTRTKPPLVVDVDHTLLRTDCFHEALLLFVHKYPLEAWKIFVWWPKGKAFLKSQIFGRVCPDLSVAPYNTAVVAVCKTAHSEGRAVVLATATPTHVANQLRDRFDWISEVIGSTSEKNLTGSKKAEAVASRFGTGQFDFISDHKRDFEVWQQCSKGWIVADRKPCWSRRLDCTLQLLPTERPLWALFTVMRPQNWIKNMGLAGLILMMYHLTDWTTAGIAVGAVSAVESAMYMARDLVCIENDRKHPREKGHAIASGRVSIPLATVTAVVLLSAGLILLT